MPSLLGLLQPLFYSVSLRDKTRPGQSLWDGAGENSLRGLFLEKMKQEYDSAASEEEKQMLLQAVQYGLAALDGREEW